MCIFSAIKSERGAVATCQKLDVQKQPVATAPGADVFYVNFGVSAVNNFHNGNKSKNLSQKKTARCSPFRKGNYS